MQDLFAIVENAKKEWETSVDAISEGLALFQPETLTILRANWPMARLFNTSPHQLVNADIHALLCGCTKRQCETSKFLHTSQAAVLEIERQDMGSQWLLYVYPTLTQEQSPHRNVIVLRDITHERLWQQRVIEAEKKTAMTHAAAKLALHIAPSASYIKHNLSAISNHLARLRSAFCDYRLALSAAGLVVGTDESQTNWQSIEARHMVEFVIQDIEQVLQHSQRDLEQIYQVIGSLSNLEDISQVMQYNDLHRVLENTLSAVWKELQEKADIQRRYGKLPLVKCNQFHLQTAFMIILINAIRFTSQKAGISVQTCSIDGQVQILITSVGSSPPTPYAMLSPLNFPSENSAPVDTAGLNPVIEIIQEHGGRIEIQALGGQANEIKVTLPVDGPAG